MPSDLSNMETVPIGVSIISEGFKLDEVFIITSAVFESKIFNIKNSIFPPE